MSDEADPFTADGTRMAIGPVRLLVAVTAGDLIAAGHVPPTAPWPLGGTTARGPIRVDGSRQGAPAAIRLAETTTRPSVRH